MVNTAQLQPDYVQDKTSCIKNSSHFSCRYVYNSSLAKCKHVDEIAVDKNTWKKWFRDTNISKPVVQSLTFVDVVKSSVFMAQKGKNSPLVAVQGRSQQRKPPELVKEVSGKRQTTHLKGPGKSRLVTNPVDPDPLDGLLLCCNRFAPIADLENDLYHDDENISLVDSCTFATQGTLGGDHINPREKIDKNDKFDFFVVVKKRVDQCSIPQIKACQDYQACKNQNATTFWCDSIVFSVSV